MNGRTLRAARIVRQWCAFAIAVTATLSAPAHAQRTAPASTAPLSEVLTGEAKREYDHARELYTALDFNGAFASFNRAYQLTRDPRLLWNMGACAKVQRHFARAHALVSAYLRDASALMSVESRSRAEETERALLGRFSVVEMRGAPAGASVLVDDEVVGRVPLPELGLDEGSHLVRLELEGFQSFEERINVKGTEPTRLDVLMSEAPAVGHLLVQAGPDDTIHVDDGAASLARWEGALAPGVHTVLVTNQDRKPWRSAVELAPRATKTLRVTLEAAPSAAVWPWITGVAALSVVAAAGGYLLFRPRAEPGIAPQGGLGTFALPPTSTP